MITTACSSLRSRLRLWWHCCVDGKRPGLATVTPRSEGEFGEGRREPMPRVDIDAEFVVAATETSHVGRSQVVIWMSGGKALVSS